MLLYLPLHYNEINLVDRGRIELPPKPCKGPVLPLSLTAHILAEVTGFEPVITISKTVALGQTKLYPNKKLGGKQRSRTPSDFSEPGFQGQSQDQPRCITFHYLAPQRGIEPRTN